MPSTGTVISNVFAPQPGPLALSDLDANFTTAVGALNTLLNYSNYFVDSSGAANSVTITVPAPLVFSYVAGVELRVKLAHTNTSATVNVNVNGLGNKQIITVDGNSPSIGQLSINSILILFYDGAAFRLLSTSGNNSGIGLFSDGTVGAPSISFLSDPDTGLYRSASNVLNFSTAGVDRGNLTGAGLAMSVPYLASDGSAAAPSVSFITDTNTGFYLVGPDDLGISIGGVIRAELSTAQGFSLGVGIPLRATAGSVAVPSISFSSDNNTGLYSSGSDTMVLATGGVNAIILDSAQNARFSGGTAALPSITFQLDTNTGMWNLAPDDIGFTTAGLTRLELHATGIFGYVPFKGEDGTVAAPQFSFTADNNTGIYRPGTNQLGIALGGGAAIAFNGATTTGVRTATFAATNKPGSGTAGPISWLPVLTAGGVQGYIPIFGA